MTTAPLTLDELAAAWGRRIRSRRAELELTQDELADRSGLSQATISYLERGLSTPTLPVLAQVAAALEQPLDDLFPWRPRDEEPAA